MGILNSTQSLDNNFTPVLLDLNVDSTQNTVSSSSSIERIIAGFRRAMASLSCKSIDAVIPQHSSKVSDTDSETNSEYSLEGFNGAFKESYIEIVNGAFGKGFTEMVNSIEDTKMKDSVARIAESIALIDQQRISISLLPTHEATEVLFLQEHDAELQEEVYSNVRSFTEISMKRIFFMKNEDGRKCRSIGQLFTLLLSKEYKASEASS
jgi:hypothetical protein